MFNIARLLPREEKFYRFLKDLSSAAETSALHLKTLVETTDPAQRAEASKAIFACKLDAKRIAAEVTEALCLTFVTPFDREDIQDLSSELYKIPKTIDKVREYLELHNLTQTEELVEQATLITEEAAGMQRMLTALIEGGKTKQILQQAHALDEIETKGDAVLSALLVRLVRDVTDTRQLILRKDIYDMLERVIDRYRDAANIALQIALKHS